MILSNILETAGNTLTGRQLFFDLQLSFLKTRLSVGFKYVLNNLEIRHRKLHGYVKSLYCNQTAHSSISVNHSFI